MFSVLTMIMSEVQSQFLSKYINSMYNKWPSGGQTFDCISYQMHGAFGDLFLLPV